MPRTVRGEIAAEQRLGQPAPWRLEDDTFEAQAVMLRLFPYLREKHPEIARAHGYEVGDDA
jgi:hypothetical protein